MIDRSHMLLCTPYGVQCHALFSMTYLADMTTAETTGFRAENGGIAAESFDDNSPMHQRH